MNMIEHEMGPWDGTPLNVGTRLEYHRGDGSISAQLYTYMGSRTCNSICGDCGGNGLVVVTKEHGEFCFSIRGLGQFWEVAKK